MPVQMVLARIGCVLCGHAATAGCVLYTEECINNKTFLHWNCAVNILEFLTDRHTCRQTSTCLHSNNQALQTDIVFLSRAYRLFML